MSQENVEIVRAALAAYMSNDEAAWRALASGDVVVSARPDQPDPVDHQGFDGPSRAAAEWLDAWDEHTFEAVRFWDSGEHVFVSIRESGRGRTSGVPMQTESTFVYTVSEGKIVHIRIFSSQDEALKAVGLAE